MVKNSINPMVKKRILTFEKNNSLNYNNAIPMVNFSKK